MPKATIIFLAYNQAPYVAEALRSALDQDYCDLEFVISDDGSTDDTRKQIEAEIIRHPRSSRCRLLPAEANLGIARSWDRAVAASTGEILLGFAGDDVSSPSRVSVTMAMFDENPHAFAVFCQARVVGKSGEILKDGYLQGRPQPTTYKRRPSDTYFEFWSGAPVLGATGAYRRELAEFFGPILRGVSEDDCYVYRALLLGAVAYTPQVLVSWRWHGNNASMGSLLDESEMRGILEARAGMCLRRRRGTLQHLADLTRAYRLGRITEARYRQERRLLGAMREVEMLKYFAIAPSAALSELAGPCLRFLAWCGWSAPSIISVLSCIKTHLSPVRTKIKKSRPL